MIHIPRKIYAMKRERHIDDLLDDLLKVRNLASSSAHQHLKGEQCQGHAEKKPNAALIQNQDTPAHQSGCYTRSGFSYMYIYITHFSAVFFLVTGNHAAFHLLIGKSPIKAYAISFATALRVGYKPRPPGGLIAYWDSEPFYSITGVHS